MSATFTSFKRLITPGLRKLALTAHVTFSVCWLGSSGLAIATDAREATDAPGFFAVPLTAQEGWQVLQYSKLPSHRVRFSAAGLEIAVDGSAMPLIYPLPAPMVVRSIRVKGRIEGSLRVTPQRQGEEKFDDYAVRVGLVEPGERTLNFVQRRLAAAWVRKLFDLAPAGSGISRIHFLNLGTEPTQIGRRRQHPLSELLLETIVAVPRPDGSFAFVHTLDKPLAAIAVWLSSDGDDTASRFSVLLEQIELRP